MSSATLDPVIGDGTAPALHARRLLYVITGGIQAMFAPMWLQMLRTSYPELEVTYAYTRSALRFTTTTAMAVASGQARSLLDAWEDQPAEATHVALAAWPDAILVHPATMSYVARLAQGQGDSPVMLALACTSAPIVLCPGLPPGGAANRAYQRNIAELAHWPNLTVMPPTRGVSLTTGDAGVGTAAYLPAALGALEELRAWRSST
ncbi:MAG TPA: flavoprotein [Jatrophihabitans sp.]|nr:flavoprotein [Jatrophihabitans sp.]